MSHGGLRRVHLPHLTSGGLFGNGHNYRVNGQRSVTRYLRVCLGSRWRPRRRGLNGGRRPKRRSRKNHGARYHRRNPSCQWKRNYCSNLRKRGRK